MIYKRPERTPGPIKLQGRSVVVHERMPVDKALRKLKKKLQTDNLMNELRALMRADYGALAGGNERYTLPPKP